MDDFETSASDSDYANSWISWFLGCKGNEYFCEIDEDYITDRFNLTYLNNEVNHYNDALELITDTFGEPAKMIEAVLIDSRSRGRCRDSRDYREGGKSSLRLVTCQIYSHIKRPAEDGNPPPSKSRWPRNADGNREKSS